MKKKNWDLITILIASPIYLLISGFFIYMIMSSMSLREEIEQRGVATQATVIECRSSQNTSSVLFEYQVKTQSGQIKTYQASNVGGGRPTDGCQLGKQIKVYYLPEAPENVFSRDSTYISMSVIGLIAISFVFWSILFEFYREKKAKRNES